MSTTASNYYSRVDENYPVKGQDNDSQGFRDNFKNLKEALRTIDTTVDDLSLNTVRVDQPADFGKNTIKNANLENTSITLVDNGAITSSLITIDYSLGSYQKFDLSAGNHELVIENWPQNGKTGSLRLAVTPSGTAYTAIQFTGNQIVNLGPEENPYFITPNIVNVFDVWNEPDNGAIFVKKISQHVFSTLTNTSTIITDTLILGQTNWFTVGNTTGTFFATQVQANSKIANLALVPNKVITTVSEALTDSPGDTVATKFGVTSTKGIYKDAAVKFSNTVTIYKVTEVNDTSSIITVDSPFPVGIGFGPITFVNPMFDDQPTLLTLSSTGAFTNTGIIDNGVGSIYAEKNRLEITYGNYGATNGVVLSTNTFVAETLPVSTATNTYDNALVDTTFIHSLLPCGSIIMWWGRKDKIPFGWALCDGSTVINPTTGEIIVTPNLIDKFVVGGGNDYFSSDGKWVGTTSTVTGKALPEGGSADPVLPKHKHGAGLTFEGGSIPAHSHAIHVDDPGHSHNVYMSFEQGGAKDNAGAPAADSSGPFAYQASYNGKNITEITKTGLTDSSFTIGESQAVAITGTIFASIDSAGVDPITGANVPPFRALYYIMKVSGPNFTGAN